MKKRGRPILSERNAEMLAKRKNGYTLAMLMEEYDLKKSTVSEVLKRTRQLEAEVKQS
jgi:Mor family transcriptional regulator